MKHARLRKPSVSQGKGTLPGDRAFLAAAAKCLPPMLNRSFPEYAETVEVPILSEKTFAKLLILLREKNRR